MCWRRWRCRRSTIPRSMATRCATPISPHRARRGCAIVDRVAAGHSATQHAARAARRSASSPARRCRRAPTRSSCRKMCASKATALSCRPGLKRGANRRAGRRGCAGRRAGAAGAAAGSPRSDVALAAAMGLTQLEVRRRVRVALFSTGDEIVEPGRRCRRAALYDANRYLLAACWPARRRGHRSRHSARRAGRACAAPSPRPRRRTTLC